MNFFQQVLPVLKSCLFLIFFTITKFGFGQIAFQLLDHQTQQPIAYAHAISTHSQQGTASNLSGEIIFRKTHALDSIKISYIGYQSLCIAITDIQQKVYLHPKTNRLKEVVIHADTDYLYEMLRLAKKSIKSKAQKSKSYFNLVSTTNSEVAERIETYYNTDMFGPEILNFNYKIGRLAVKPVDKKVWVSSGSSKAILLHKTLEYNLNFPLSPVAMSKQQAKKKFLFQLVNQFQEGNDVISVIEYAPKASVLGFSGKIWINTSTNSIQKITFEKKDAQRHPFMALSTGELIAVDLFISKTFGKNSKGNYLQQLDFNYQIQFKYNNEEKTRTINTEAALFNYDFKQLFSLPLFEFNDGMHGDYRKINATPFNATFWKHNSEFNLYQSQQNIAFFMQANQKESNELLFSNGLDQVQGFESPYLFWKKDHRIKFLYSKPKEANDSKKNIMEMAHDKYQLKAQIFLDINSFQDTLQFTTATVFDPYQSYYYLPVTDTTFLFFNLYFDLVESERITLEKELSTVKTEEEARKKYRETLVHLKVLETKFFKEMERGYSEYGLNKWNQYIDTTLGINNLQDYLNKQEHLKSPNSKKIRIK